MRLDIDPKVDYVFKRLFGTERNIALLVAVLNAILELPPGAVIVGVEILNPFQERDFETDKLTILDIKARDSSGRLFNVEMQLLVVGALQARILYYWAKLHQSHLTEGEAYAAIRPTVTIVFVNDELFTDVLSWHSVFELRERHAGVIFSDQLQIHVLEIPKFHLAAEELKTPLERWMYFLKHGAELDPEQLPRALHEPVYQQAIGEMQQMTQNDIERERYESRLKAQRDFVATIEEREQKGYLRGRSEGRSEGRAEGRSEGRAEGRSEGRAEGLVEGLVGQIHFCQRVLKQPLMEVAQLRNLPLAELEQLARNLEEQVGRDPASPT